jgi:predicted peptidase
VKELFSGVVAAMVGVALCGCRTPAAPEGKQPHSKGMAQTYHFNKISKQDLSYLLFLPDEYGQEPGKKWPLLLFLHGSGERGTDVWKVATHGPPNSITNKSASFPFIIVAPQCPEGQIWQGEPLLGLIDEVSRKFRVDSARVYATGLSMGGYGTWELGTTFPERFAAIAPVCGGGELISVLLASRQKAAALKTLGIWAFHGAKDPVVPVEESQRMIEAVKKAGAEDVKLTIYPEARHDSWTETYRNPELYQWLLAHRRSE